MKCCVTVLPGLEKPGLFAAMDKFTTLSGVRPDLAGESLLPESIEKLRASTSHDCHRSGQPALAPAWQRRKFVCIGLNIPIMRKRREMPIPPSPYLHEGGFGDLRPRR